MKLHTLNMKKAVSKCLQVDAPETELPPLRYLNRFTNNLVNMANNNHHQSGHNQEADSLEKMMKMKIMMNRMMNSHEGHDRMDNMDSTDSMDMFAKMFRGMKSNKYDQYKSNDFSPMMQRFMSGFQREADDSLELN